MQVRFLDWDSEFFGMSVGRLEAEPDEVGADPATLRAALDVARADGIRCVYASIDPADRELVMSAAAVGMDLVEVAQDLIHRDSLIAHQPPTVSRARPGTEADLGAVIDEIALMAPWSRYAMDPRFGLEAARRMHLAWVERAISDPDRSLVVAEDDEGISGFSTTATLPGEDPRIDLIASSRSGTGAAYAIVADVFGRFGRVRSWGGPIAARNVVSLRFCENMGYRIGTVRYLYHHWLDADGAG